MDDSIRYEAQFSTQAGHKKRTANSSSRELQMQPNGTTKSNNSWTRIHKLFVAEQVGERFRRRLRTLKPVSANRKSC